MAGRQGNKNAMTHGKFGFLATGRAPKGCGYVYRLLGQLRRALEAETVAKHGEISLYHGALMQTAVRHEGRAQLLTRWLRQSPDVSLSDRLAVLREIGSASDSRDKCLRLLGFDRATGTDIFAALYATPILAHDVATPDDGGHPHEPTGVQHAEHAAAGTSGNGVANLNGGTDA